MQAEPHSFRSRRRCWSVSDPGHLKDNVAHFTYGKDTRAERQVGSGPGSATKGYAAVKLVAEYLEQAVNFERMAAEATDPKLKESLQDQAAAYRQLADKRAAELKLPPVNLPDVTTPRER
jgi:hypothetical protein